MVDKKKYEDEIMSDNELDGVVGGVGEIFGGCNDTISAGGNYNPGMANSTVYSGNNVSNSFGSGTNQTPNVVNPQTPKIIDGDSIIHDNGVFSIRW